MDLTPAQVAETLGISTSTLRKWANVLGDRLSEQATPPAGRHRSYTERDLAILRQAQNLIRSGTPLHAAAIELDASGLLDVEEPGQEPEPLEIIAEALAQLADQNVRIARLEAAMARLQKELEKNQPAR